MALAYSEFLSTPATLAADIRTKILLSTDWSQPNSGSLPNLVACTTTAGAAMRVEFSPSAMTNDNYRIGVRAWRAHNGTTGTDNKDYMLNFRDTGVGGGTTADRLYVTVSASKDCLYVSVEGPRIGDANAEDASRGSTKTYFFMSALVPYFAGDTNPVVVVGGFLGNNINPRGSNMGPYGAVFVSQGADATTQSWAPATVSSLQPLAGNVALQPYMPQPISVLDSNNYYMYPLVITERTAGIRGTMSDLYFAGFNIIADVSNTFDIPAALGQTITYSGKSYKLQAVSKAHGAFGGSSYMYHPLGAQTQYTTGQAFFQSTVIGIRTA
jgi:hypothetical protein